MKFDVKAISNEIVFVNMTVTLETYAIHCHGKSMLIIFVCTSSCVNTEPEFL